MLYFNTNVGATLTMGKAKTSDRTRDARRMAKLFRDGGYSHDQSKHLIADGTMSCSTGNTSSDQNWLRGETSELYRIRLHVSACYPL